MTEPVELGNVQLADTMTADQLLGFVRERMGALRPLVEEHDRLAQADAALDRALDARA